MKQVIRNFMLWAPFSSRTGVPFLLLRGAFCLARCAILTAAFMAPLSLVPGFNPGEPAYFVPMWLIMVTLEELSRYSMIRYSIMPYLSALVYLAMFLLLETIGYLPDLASTGGPIVYIATRAPSIALHIVVSVLIAWASATEKIKPRYLGLPLWGVHLAMNIVAWTITNGRAT